MNVSIAGARPARRRGPYYRKGRALVQARVTVNVVALRAPGDDVIWPSSDFLPPPTWAWGGSSQQDLLTMSGKFATVDPAGWEWDLHSVCRR